MPDQEVGKILAIALRDPNTGPMREVSEATALEHEGLQGDPKTSLKRGLTLIASRQWEQVIRELDVDLPWHTRRANVLVEADALAHLIGKTVRVGEAKMAALAETKPCGLMDKLHRGLRAALAPDGRGGVYGRITSGGTIRVGDAVTIIE